jgi:hypothetical protein
MQKSWKHVPGFKAGYPTLPYFQYIYSLCFRVSQIEMWYIQWRRQLNSNMRKDTIKYSGITLHIGDCTRPLPTSLAETMVSANIAFYSQVHFKTGLFSYDHLERNSIKISGYSPPNNIVESSTSDLQNWKSHFVAFHSHFLKLSLYIYIYLFIYLFMCVCVCVCVNTVKIWVFSVYL